jgi:hypothetical protein
VALNDLAGRTIPDEPDGTQFADEPAELADEPDGLWPSCTQLADEPEVGPELARVTLAKSNGKAFGARIVDTETQEVGLMIARISANGALSEWNARNPSRSVAPGDSIVEVNGLTAAWAIME